MSDEPVFDTDNPEWTAEDFRRARPLDAFPMLKAALRRRERTPSTTQAPAKKAG